MLRRLILITLISTSVFCQEAKRQASTIYFQGGYGTSIPLKYDNKYRHEELEDYETSTDNSSGYQLALGKKWKYVGVELVYGDLGKTTVKYEDMFDVQRSATFFGAGFHWFLWIFEIRLGWASYKGNRKFIVQKSPDKSLEITPLQSKINGGGMYFGIGLSFDLDDSMSVFFDSTGHSFKEKSVTYKVDGDEQTLPDPDKLEEGEESKITGTIGIATIGLRFSF